MSSGRVLLRSKAALAPIRRLCTRESASGRIQKQSGIVLQKTSALKHFRNSDLLKTYALYPPLASFNGAQTRGYADLPSKQQVERFTYKAIARTIDFINRIRASEGYRDLKQWMWNSYIWSIDTFKKRVVENPKVKYYSNDFKRKLEEAREHRSK